MLRAFISITFFVFFSVYLFLGICSVSINVKALLNRVFLFVCIGFSVWTISFALANSSQTSEGALLWRRASAVGWGIVYSVMLHFVLVLTEKTKLLKTKWIYGVLYIPAILNIFLFGICNEIAHNQYQRVIKTVAGWAFVPNNTVWDTYFNIYYIGCSLIIFGLLFHWGKNTKDIKKKKNANYLLGSLVIALALGSITDSFINRFFEVKIPSLAPIVIMIPMATIMFIIKKYGLMYPYGKKTFMDENIILDDKNRFVFYKYISSMFYIGSMLNLLHYFLYPSQLNIVILFSTVLIGIGAAIFFIPLLSFERNIQDSILSITIALSIPIILLRFLDNYASNIVWPIPIIFMIVMAVFNKKRTLFIIAFAGLFTTIVSWIRIPQLTTYVTGVDYVSRIVLYGMGFILTAYVNKVYIARIKENKEQFRFQKMVSEISTDFITVTESNFNDKVEEMLKRSGEYFHSDRSHLYMFSDNYNTVQKVNEWYKDKIKHKLVTYEEIAVSQYKWWLDQMRANQTLFILSSKDLPQEAKEEQEFLKLKGISSALVVPVANKEKVIGLIAFDGVKEKKSLSEMDREQLKVLANTLADAISKVEAEREINYLAYNDVLTGLPNRAFFKHSLENEINLIKHTSKTIGVMLIDLDGFKEVNDTMGHDCGDYVLIQVAKRLSQATKGIGFVARFGGDEFLIMLAETNNKDDVVASVDNIMSVFKEPIIAQNQEFFLTASGGIALFPTDGETVEVLIKNADLAMYSSKAKGKNQYCLCSPEMKEEVLSKMKLTNSLYRALENNEFELYYQPQINIQSKEIIGIEALIRWNHPTLGKLLPAVFIPLAEQAGLITSIGTWVIKTACEQNKKWQCMGLKPVRIAVNISMDQFRGNLVQVVKETLKDTELDARYLELEIMEGVVMKEGSLIINTLRELRNLGVEISIDDFGMAYSSLSRLKDLPVNRLKIDMFFVQGILPNSKDNSIIEVMIHLAKSLDLKVTAEGVETECQLEFLAEKNCDDIQGYYYYKPMPKEEIELIFKERML